MVCGELPFDVDDENDMKTLVYKITNGVYTIPDNVSSEFKDLISKILEINPDKRINIDDIKKHSWVRMFNFDYMKSPGVFLDEYFLPIDIYLIKEITGEDENKIRKVINDILVNKHNVNTIDYYLKNEAKKRRGEKSVSDLRATSELFIEYINSEISNKKKWNNDIKKIGEYYINQILELFKMEKMKNLEIQKEIKNSLKIDDNNNENVNKDQDKKHQMLKFKTELKINTFNNNNQNNEEKLDNKNKINNKDNQDKEKEKAQNKDKRIKSNNRNTNIDNAKDKKNNSNKKTNLEIVNLYIGPLIFIHDLIDNIITNVINIEKEKNKINETKIKKSSNFLVSSSIKMEITKNQKIQNKSTDNDITKENGRELLKEKTERKTSIQEQFSINKANNIELVSTPKRIKTSFSYVNKVQSESVEINSIQKINEKDKRSGSCQLRKKNKKLTHNFKSKSIAINNGRKILNKNNKNKINKTKTNGKSNIIKSIDLTMKGVISPDKKTNIIKRKIRSNSNINHLQINIIQNEIIIADNNFIKKSTLKSKNEIGLIKNRSQNYFFILNENINLDTKISKNTLTNQSRFKPKNRNKIPISKFHNRSVDIKREKSSKKESINIKKNNYANKNIIIPVRKEKNCLNKFLKTPNNKDKYIVGITSNKSSFYSPENNQGLVKNIFTNDETTPFKKEFIPLKPKKNKSILSINNMGKDFSEINNNSCKYYPKKLQEKNIQHNSQVISLLSHPNENESAKKDKNINISIYKYAKSPNKEFFKQNNVSIKSMLARKTCINNQVTIIKIENAKESQNKKKNKNNKNNNIEKEDDKLIKTKLPLYKIKQIIKKYVGNNVQEIKDNGIFKYICKAKFGKDELIFHLELVSKTYDSFTFKGILVKGETKLYKELLSKIKEQIM